MDTPQWTQAGQQPGDHSWGNGTKEPLRAGLARRTETIVEAQSEEHTMRHFIFCHLEFLDFSRTSSIAVTAATKELAYSRIIYYDKLSNLHETATGWGMTAGDLAQGTLAAKVHYKSNV